jgi:hypothetical protein
LPAYHDDIVARDYSVGLGFEITFGNKTSKIVISSDTSLFPTMRKPSGSVIKYDDPQKTPKLEVDERKALYNKYPAPFNSNPDLLVVHLGSIKEFEFNSIEPDFLTFYPNHLGLLGTIIMIDKIQPEVAIISEFGEELKDIKMEIVNKISEVIKEKHEDNITPFITPADLTIVYNIEKRNFFCHDTHSFEDIQEIYTYSYLASNVDGKWANSKRTFIIKDKDNPCLGEAILNYYEKLKTHKLKYFNY